MEGQLFSLGPSWLWWCEQCETGGKSNMAARYNASEHVIWFFTVIGPCLDTSNFEILMDVCFAVQIQKWSLGMYWWQCTLMVLCNGFLYKYSAALAQLTSHTFHLTNRFKSFIMCIYFKISNSELSNKLTAWHIFQLCHMSFGSWTHSKHELNLTLAFPAGIDLSTFDVSRVCQLDAIVNANKDKHISAPTTMPQWLKHFCHIISDWLQTRMWVGHNQHHCRNWRRWCWFSSVRDQNVSEQKTGFLNIHSYPAMCVPCFPYPCCLLPSSRKTWQNWTW